MARKKRGANRRSEKRRAKALKQRERTETLKGTIPQRRVRRSGGGRDLPKSLSLPSDSQEQTTAGLNDLARDFGLFPLLQELSMQVRPELLLDHHPNVRDTLKNSARVETAAVFGAMLLDKRLQSNCIRLEAAVHLAVAVGEGSRLATQKQLAECFNRLGHGICGQMEDPAENVFVSLVTTSEGNFRVLEGVWECGTFYLQQILELVESMPNEGPFGMLRRRVYALLQISEAVCARAGLVRYSVGATTPRSKVNGEFFSKSKRDVVYFDRDDLADLGLTREDLDVFIFDDQVVAHVLSEPITNSPLQRFPIMDAGERLALVLPSAVSFAIRAAIVDFLILNNFQMSLRTRLAENYAAFFQSTRLLGSYRRAPLYFADGDSLPIADMMTTADEGRFLHFVFFTDTFDGFYETGLAGVDPGPATHADLLETRVRAAIKCAKQQLGFRQGVTLLVYCGIGRSVVLPLPKVSKENWSIQFLSAADLFTLSSTSKFDALKLWKALEGVNRLADLGVQMHNHNGLLNLIAWIDANEGHLVSHSQVPKGFRHSHGGLFLGSNFVLDLRHRVAIENDIHGVRTVDGGIEVVRHVRESFFPEDNDIPIYAGNNFSNEDGLPFAYVSNRRAWWCHVKPSPHGVGDYDRWLMLKTWLARIVPIIEPILDRGLKDTVLLRVTFQSCDDNHAAVPTRDDIERSCSITLAAEESTVTVTVGEQFELGLAHPTNISERVLVVVICHGFAQLANVSLTADQLNSLESQIIKSDDARQMHAFQGRSYRDFVQDDLREKLLQLDDLDIADLRTGLAFRAESRDKGRSSLRSKRQCTSLLNAIVRDLENELCSELHHLDRAWFVELCLRNHEKAHIDRARWVRTARANLALHHDKQAALDVITEQDLNMSGVILPSRVLIELALCECPENGGKRAGHLDFSKLMAKLNTIWHLGGWSDAIHLDAMPPKLVITPLGDVQAVTDFESNILMPFSKIGSHVKIASAVEDYEKNFELPKVANTFEIDSEFEDAWNQEFGFTVHGVREFMDAIEDVGLHRKQVVFRVKKGELVSLLQPQLEKDQVERIVDALGLRPRESWRTIPEGFNAKDIQPWRFRRQLSSVRRPLIQLDGSDDPELLLAPGFIRGCVAYVFRSYYEGSFPDWQYRTKAMRQWYGKRANARGSEFATRVAERIRGLGWTAKTEIEVREILGCRDDPDFGDLSRYGDVDVLAWNESANRVLLIECKHLHFHKTAGEIAEQLSDYRGRTRRNGKPDDLAKHLKRLEILNARKAELCKAIGAHDGAQVEGWILFKNPVPMLYSWKEFESRIQIATFDDIASVLNN